MPQQPVIITDVEIPFARMVVIILKLMVASIPAIILFYLVSFVCALFISGWFRLFFANLYGDTPPIE
jgi:hypothetical protein